MAAWESHQIRFRHRAQVTKETALDRLCIYSPSLPDNKMDIHVGHNPCKGFIVNYLSLWWYTEPQSRERELGEVLHSNDVSKQEKISGYWGDAATNQLFHRLLSWHTSWAPCISPTCM